MKSITIPTLALLFIAMTFVSCDNSNPMAEVNYEFNVNKATSQAKVKSTDSSPTLMDTANVQFSSGYITIREIVFDGDMVEGGSVSITHEQVAEIDVATGNTTPSLDAVQIPAGTYSSPNLGIELQDVNDQPQMVINGTFTDDTGSQVPLRFEFNSGEVFEAESDQVTLVENQVATAVITFDPVFWFSDVTTEMLNNATRNGEGVIVISETSNADIFTNVADKLDVATQATFQ
ncbi:MAG: hypothetical protein R3222_09320 [Balneolaceae bacterium]|nr:hypothetical protein [Balneolaceae bacterium]